MENRNTEGTTENSEEKISALFSLWLLGAVPFASETVFSLRLFSVYVLLSLTMQITIR